MRDWPLARSCVLGPLLLVDSGLGYTGSLVVAAVVGIAVPSLCGSSSAAVRIWCFDYRNSPVLADRYS